MQNFDYQTPTRLIFGSSAIENLPQVLAPYGKKVLLTYGGGSIKANGLYDRVMALLVDFEIWELAGIQPNPKYDPSVLEGVRLCKAHDIDVLLAVGGGSVLDCTKAIAGGACYEGDPWDLITYKAETKAALPIVDVMTMAATGSEYDCGGVISRTETNDKVGYASPLVFPAVSILDPTYTFTVSARQTAAGAADAMNHIMEQYFCAESTLLNDGFCEAALRSIMVNVRAALADPYDYTARAELFQAATYGCNGIYSLGNSESGWSCHAMEHALSAYYDINHGEGLAILTPHWMQHILSEKTVARFVKYGVNVFGLDPSQDRFDIAGQAIEATSAFFASIGLPAHLSQVGIDARRIDEMAAHVAQTEGLEEAWVPLFQEDIAAIFRASL
jgi:alcohol dehydrogenase YqhD (iron-dependent ADH family)